MLFGKLSLRPQHAHPIKSPPSSKELSCLRYNIEQNYSLQIYLSLTLDAYIVILNVIMLSDVALAHSTQNLVGLSC